MNRSTKPLIDEFQNQDKYQIIEAFSHDEVIPITRKYLFRANLPTLIYLFINICALVFGIYSIFKSESLLFDKLSYFGLGFLFAFLILLPVHEYVHYFAYKLFGAKNVRVEYKWQQMTALCIADKFILNAKSFAVVALAPFFLINSLILLACFFGSENARIFLSGALLLHTGACSGDFGLVNLVWIVRARKSWTFDDSENRMSYFFKEINV